MEYRSFEEPSAVFEVRDGVLTVADGTFYGAELVLATGEPLATFGGPREYAIETKPEVVERGGRSFVATDHGVTVHKSGANPQAIAGARLFECGSEGSLLLVDLEGNVSDIGEGSKRSLGRFPTSQHPHAVFLEGDELHIVTADGQTLADSSGACWTMPEVVRQIEPTTSGYVTIDEPRGKRVVGGNIRFFEFETRRDILPCREVRTTSRLVDLRTSF